MSAAASRTTATFPPVAARFVVPVASGAGGAAPFAPEARCRTEYEPPAGIDPASDVTDHDVPAAVAYWSDQPDRLTAEVPRLKSSM